MSTAPATSGPALPPPAAIRELIIRPRTGWVAIDWREWIEGWELLYFLVLRDVKVRYKQTVLGVAWAVLQPVLNMVIFTIIFGRLAGIPSEDIPYPVFVFAGLLPWTFFANSVAQGSQSLVNQQPLLTKIYMPRVFIPASAIGSALVDLAVASCVLGIVMAIYGIAPGWGIAALPLLVVLTVATALGVTLCLSALTVSYRDFRYVVPFLVQVWMFLSPVIYPVSLIPERWRWAAALNPMSGLIGGFRSALLDKPWDWPALAVSGTVGIVMLVFGLYFFRRMERRFADVA